MIYAVSTHNNLDSLWLKLSYTLWYFLKPNWCPHHHHHHHHHHQVFQSRRYIWDFNWYCSLTATLLILKIKFLLIKILRCTFTYWQSVPNFRNHQTMVSIRVLASKNWTSTICEYLFLSMKMGWIWLCFSHQEKSNCIYECSDVGTVHS